MGITYWRSLRLGGIWTWINWLLYLPAILPLKRKSLYFMHYSKNISSSGFEPGNKSGNSTSVLYSIDKHLFDSGFDRYIDPLSQSFLCNELNLQRAFWLNEHCELHWQTKCSIYLPKVNKYPAISILVLKLASNLSN